MKINLGVLAQYKNCFGNSPCANMSRVSRSIPNDSFVKTEAVDSKITFGGLGLFKCLTRNDNRLFGEKIDAFNNVLDFVYDYYDSANSKRAEIFYLIKHDGVNKDGKKVAEITETFSAKDKIFKQFGDNGLIVRQGVIHEDGSLSMGDYDSSGNKISNLEINFKGQILSYDECNGSFRDDKVRALKINYDDETVSYQNIVALDDGLGYLKKEVRYDVKNDIYNYKEKCTERQNLFNDNSDITIEDMCVFVNNMSVEKLVLHQKDSFGAQIEKTLLPSSKDARFILGLDSLFSSACATLL